MLDDLGNIVLFYAPDSHEGYPVVAYHVVQAAKPHRGHRFFLKISPVKGPDPNVIGHSFP